jgi:hypothetical protein
MDPGVYANLIDKYGIPIVVIAMFAVAIVVLFKLNRDSNTASQAAAIKVLQDALELERAARVKAEARLDSNTTALKEATVGFNAALGVMEKLADRDEGPVPASRRRAPHRATEDRG